MYKAIQCGARKESSCTGVCQRKDTIVHVRVSHTGQGLYKVAEVTGTMIQNRKDISIYINTQPGGWGGCWVILSLLQGAGEVVARNCYICSEWYVGGRRENGETRHAHTDVLTLTHKPNMDTRESLNLFNTD